MIIYLCVKFESNTPIFSKDIARKPFVFFLVPLSLLTMTNPNQLYDVLLFVCSKMADETNLSFV